MAIDAGVGLWWHGDALEWLADIKVLSFMVHVIKGRRGADDASNDCFGVMYNVFKRLPCSVPLKTCKLRRVQVGDLAVSPGARHLPDAFIALPEQSLHEELGRGVEVALNWPLFGG